MTDHESIEKKVKEALVAELNRQLGGTVAREDSASVQINGAVNLDDLALAVVGAVAGGP